MRQLARKSPKVVPSRALMMSGTLKSHCEATRCGMRKSAWKWVTQFTHRHAESPRPPHDRADARVERVFEQNVLQVLGAHGASLEEAEARLHEKDEGAAVEQVEGVDRRRLAHPALALHLASRGDSVDSARGSTHNSPPVPVPGKSRFERVFFDVILLKKFK